MLIACWNVNSLKTRLAHVLDWLDAHRPDVLMLQELQGLEFPHAPFEKLGYNCASVGQKAYNGVAIVARKPFDVDLAALPGDASDIQARYLEITMGALNVINIHLPNGNPIGTEKFEYKLAWLDRLKKRMTALKIPANPLLSAGTSTSFRKILIASAQNTGKTTRCSSPSRVIVFRSFIQMGYVHGFWHFNDEPGHYTSWEYFRDQFAKNQSIRINHFLVSPAAARRITGCIIDTQPRRLLKPSDLAPIVLAMQ